jgi:hypothetical protein
VAELPLDVALVGLGGGGEAGAQGVSGEFLPPLGFRKISADPKGPLFRTIGRTTGQLTTTPLPQANAHAMIRRRAGVAEVLMEYFQQVRASDVFDYGCGYEVGSFVGCGPDVVTVPSVPDWIWLASSRCGRFP